MHSTGAVPVPEPEVPKNEKDRPRFKTDPFVTVTSVIFAV